MYDLTRLDFDRQLELFQKVSAAGGELLDGSGFEKELADNDDTTEEQQ